MKADAGVRFEPALATDLGGVLALVRAAQLPLAGVEDQFPRAYVLARRGATVIGAAGLEVYGNVGLLRSLVVHSGVRGQGLGRLLVEERLRAASARGLFSVYLLTTTAAALFRRLGFVDLDRAEAPAELAASPEFSFACPASALCLAWRPR